MYSYHNRIKQRISNGEFIGAELVGDYPNIGECLVLYFNTEPFMRPIRQHRYHEYKEIIMPREKEGFQDQLERIARCLV